MRTLEFAAIIAVGLLASCEGTLSSGVAKPPEYKPGGGQGKCSVKGGQAKPLIVEWPSAARGDLELQAKKGIVAVRYTGCEMEILSRCTAPGTYTYGAFTAKGDKVVIRDEDELYANIPVGAAKLEAKLQSAGQLTVEMKLVGKYEADRSRVREDELKGDCDDATHFIAGLTVGAFDFFAGSEGAISGGVDVVGVGAGVKSGSKRESLTQDGSADACAKATQEDARPPSGCGAILRLEVVRLGEAKLAESACPEGSAWNGTQCIRKRVVTKVDCPKGATWDGSRCAATVDTSCNTGTHFVDGRGCVANTAPSAPPTCENGRYVILDAGSADCSSTDGSGLVRDTSTGLTWMRHSAGDTPSQAGAATRCAQASMRLPTRDEAIQVAGANHDSCAFPCGWSTWTSTSGGPGRVWGVLVSGMISDDYSGDFKRHYVLCVR